MYCFSIHADQLSFEIQGLDDKPLTNAQNRVKIIRNAFEKQVTQRELKRFRQMAPKAITEALAPYGYLNPKIKQRIKHKQNAWHVLFVVEPGPPTHVTDVEIKLIGEGRNNETLRYDIDHFAIKKGDQFNAETYSAAKDQLLSDAIGEGFFDVSYAKSKIYISRKRNQARIVLHLNTGPQYYIGPIDFSKNPLNETLLRRYLPFHMGDPFRSEQVENLQKDLNQSGYFAQARVLPQHDDTYNHHIPLKIDLSARPARLYQIGVGAGSDTGPRVSGTVLFRHLTSTGHQLALTGRLSYRHRLLAINYMIPGRHPASERYILTGAMYSEDYANGLTNKRKLSFQSIRNLWQINQTIGLSLENEHSEPRNKSNIRTLMLIPSIYWQYVYRTGDHPTQHNQGIKLGLGIKGGAEKLLSDEDFLQTQINWKWIQYLPLYNRLDIEGMAGVIAVNDIDALPLSLQFYTGGSKKLRGYDFNEIGPGKGLFSANFQIQNEVYNSIYVGPFYDIGNASNTPFKDPHSSAGVVATWLSPIGAIEVSFAHAFTEQGKPFKFQFSMGPDL